MIAQSMWCRMSFTCHRCIHLPTTSVLLHPSASGGPDRRHSSSRRRRPRPAAPGPPPGGRSKPRGPVAHCLGPEGAGDGDGTCQVTGCIIFPLKHVSATCLKTKISLYWIGKSCTPITTYDVWRTIQTQCPKFYLDITYHNYIDPDDTG